MKRIKRKWFLLHNVECVFASFIGKMTSVRCERLTDFRNPFRFSLIHYGSFDYQLICFNKSNNVRFGPDEKNACVCACCVYRCGAPQIVRKLQFTNGAQKKRQKKTTYKNGSWETICCFYYSKIKKKFSIDESRRMCSWSLRPNSSRFNVFGQLRQWERERSMRFDLNTILCSNWLRNCVIKHELTVWVFSFSFIDFHRLFFVGSFCICAVLCCSTSVTSITISIEEKK